MADKKFSRIGLIVSLVYAALAFAAVSYDLLRAPSGGWLDLRGIETCIATLPACYVVNQILPKIGLPRPDFYHGLQSLYTLIIILFSILACATILYIVTSFIQKRFFKKGN